MYAYSFNKEHFYVHDRGASGMKTIFIILFIILLIIIRNKLIKTYRQHR